MFLNSTRVKAPNLYGDCGNQTSDSVTLKLDKRGVGDDVLGLTSPHKEKDTENKQNPQKHLKNKNTKNFKVFYPALLILLLEPSMSGQHGNPTSASSWLKLFWKAE